jgi:outer membrane lipoprotein carrier protein
MKTPGHKSTICINLLEPLQRYRVALKKRQQACLPKAAALHSFEVRHKEYRIALQALFLVCCFLSGLVDGYSADLKAAIDGLQRRYASVKTVTADFQQFYRAPGIEQVESGVFWMKKPGLMRWEYRIPESRLFIADGRESYLYEPQNRQVTVQSYDVSDTRDTPLGFLLGAGDIDRSFVSSWETALKPAVEGTLIIRMTPRKSDPYCSYLILEIDRQTYDLRRILIREPNGSTSEFLLTKMAVNVKVNDRDFQFKVPKGVEVIRLMNDR